MEYKELECSVCQEKTSFLEVDTVDGRKFCCEQCGTYEGETVEDSYARMLAKRRLK